MFLFSDVPVPKPMPRGEGRAGPGQAGPPAAPFLATPRALEI